MKSAACLLAALSCFASVLALELETPVKLPHVPTVRNPGSDGFPTLISVQSAMTDYMQGKDSLNHHASVLGLHLKKLEKDDTERIIQQNHVYEQKLRLQEEANQAIAIENAQLAKGILKVRKAAEKLSTLTEKEQKLVRLRRDQFATMKKELLKGQQRVNSILESIPSLDDASNLEKEPASFLEITEDRAHPTQETSARETDGMSTEIYDRAQSIEALLGPSEMETEKTSEKASLSNVKLGLSEIESETGSLVQSLAAEIAKLHENIARTLAKLKESFDVGYQAGAKRHEGLLKQQSMLKNALESGRKRALKLKAEYKNVAALRKDLDQQLVKNGAFLGNLQKMAAS